MGFMQKNSIELILSSWNKCVLKTKTFSVNSSILRVWHFEKEKNCEKWTKSKEKVANLHSFVQRRNCVVQIFSQSVRVKNT